MIDDDHLVLEMRNVSKSFAGVRALEDVDISIAAGEVHCILGQNGAGKSTLIKILSGVHKPDGGEIFLRGEQVTIADPTQALGLGIATMYQELDVVDGLTIAENIFLGHELSVGGFLRRPEINAKARQLMKRLGHGDLSPNREVGTLSAANKQIVSMARALSRDATIIIMDEPSAVLDSQEVKNLFRVVRELTDAGIAVVYISHRLEEIREIGDRISVLKDGRSMANGLSVEETPTKELIKLMTGRTVENVFPPAPPLAKDAPVLLSVENLGVRGIFSGVSFTVRAGEVVGLAGLVGAGRSEIMETIYGARKATSGSVSVSGDRLNPGSVPDAVAHGMGLSPEERKAQGLIIDQPVFENVTLASFARFARFSFLDERAERQAARQQIAALQLRPSDPDMITRSLSGGNQQKILLARWLVQGTKVLLLDEPTRGVDVGARAEIYALIRKLSADGTAIVIVSSEISEVLGLADRVLVIADGAMLVEIDAAAIDELGVLDLVMKGNAA